ncbi:MULTISPECIES: AMP-binding protein [unclassified Streptomyces]|uniref:AMP-binding protein n=1 Tax=unclassified Streptomyces TaxID=2593676 RepID=UPI002DD9A4C0|nr:AMP-binding protein [Streptomyces sp. NBC_01766]WSC18185.1 AMP-binding protein [Streptomyces sp. NBC_01766]
MGGRVSALVAGIDDWYDDSTPLIEFGEHTVSRGEFSALTCRIAGQLSDSGLRQGDVVAVRDCEGWQWIAVMLGIWRSGGIFLPQTASESAQHAPRPCLTVHCSAPGGPAVVGRAEAGATRLTDGTAYLLPTSGSTGRSKWIQGTLHGLDHFVAWEIQELQAGQGDICAQLTAPTFDPVLREVLVPLVAGARLAVPPDRSGLVRSSAAVDWLARTGVTLVHAVPTLARLWCSGNSRTELPSLRALLLAGEPLYEGDLHAWADRFGTGATLYNLYGPSETTLAKCAQRIDLTLIKEVVSEGKVAVGPPLPECEVLVADGDRRCDPYEVGEVLIRTPHASNGYWNMPDLNGERFVRNPFAEEDPLRIFRTRDLGYQLPDGRLVVEGRIDGEYKFRGIRVDLGLIEDAIRRVPGVRDAGVKVATPPAGPAVLAAYVVTDRPVQDIAHELPTDLEGPRPGAWKAVAELPRTHSGKLQRNALPALVVGEGTTDDTADQDPSVRTLLGIWREVMPLAPGLGPHSSFTDAGGQSIEAVQALTRIEDEFGTTLELRDILDLQTPYRIAARIGGQGVPHRSRTRLGSVPAVGPQLLTGAQERFWEWIGCDSEPVRFQFLWAARLTGQVDTARLAEAADTVLRSADGQWLAFSGSGSQVRQSSVTPHPAVEVVRPPKDADPRIWCRTDAERLAVQPFAFGTEPLMRVRIYPLGPDETALVLVNHVLASDGWTKEQYLRQISAAYAGEEPGETLQFSAYAAWEAEQRSQWPDRSGYWHDRLQQLTAMRLPWRSGAGNNQLNHALRTVSWSLDREESQALRAACAAAGTTLPSAIAAALIRALQEWTGQQEGQLLLSNAKRPDPCLNSTLGCFTDSTVLPYGALPEAPAAAARAVGDEIGTALQQSQPSFLWLLRRYRPDLDPHHPRTFPVIFAPQSDYSTAVNLPGVRANALDWGERLWMWPLEVYPVVTGPEIHFHLHHATEYFDHDRVRELAAALRAELTRLAADPAPEHPTAH